ncbi:MAG: CotH kinase family protein [Acidobacteria bacterium]|nr:CotH kinase family protein [Acidobacteriota bacterium]
MRKYQLAGVLVVAGLVWQRGEAQGPPVVPALEDRPLVAQFDRDGNERLDAAERKTAREWLAAQPAAGPGAFFGGGRGRGRGPGAPPGFGGRGLAPTSPGRRLTPADVRTYPGRGVYDLDTLRTVFIQFENADWEQELEAFYRTDVEVPATVTIDGSVFRDVGVHFRGMSSYFMTPAGSKRSLNLSLDFVHDDQQFGGYRTFNLLNAANDPAFVRTVLYSEIARTYIPAPAANYVRVVINGESWGVYVNAQQFNRDFTRDWFMSTRGARWRVPGSPGARGGMEYLGPDAAAYKRVYEIRTRDAEASWADLIAMFRVLSETPPDRLEAELAPRLDIDGALKFLALEVTLVNSDGYWARASDYSLYQDERGRFHVIPHDMNEGLAEERGPGGFGRGAFQPPPGFEPPPGFPAGGFPGGRGGGRGGPGFPFADASVELDPLVGLDDPTKPLRSKLLAVPALRERYLAYVREIATNWLDWQRIEPMVRRYQALIAEDVKADTRKLYSTEQFETGVSGGEESLRSFIERRRAFLLRTR